LSLGLLLIGVAAVYLIGSLRLSMGSATRMGPGYFPMLLVGLLSLLGVLIVLRGLRRVDSADAPAIGWRGIIIVSSSVILFAVSVTTLGFGPAVAIAATVSSFASAEARPVERVALAAGLVAFCWLVFIAGLNLRVPLLGPLLVGS
jgi:putative tricarboxylic transport membrane protein